MTEEEYYYRKWELVKDYRFQKSIHCERNAANRRRRLVALVKDAENVDRERAQVIVDRMLDDHE